MDCWYKYMSFNLLRFLIESIAIEINKRDTSNWRAREYKYNSIVRK